MDNLKKMVIIILIVISILIISILILKMNKKEVIDDIVISDFENTNTYVPKKVFKKVSLPNKYYAVKNILNRYVNYLKEANGVLEEGQDNIVESKEQAIKKMLDILDKQYIDEFKIKKELLQKKIANFDNYILDIDEMYVYELSSNINAFLVYATIDNKQNNFIVKTDSRNLTFSIYLQDYIDKYNYAVEMNDDDFEIKEDLPEKNDNNTFKFVNISEQYLALQYTQDFFYKAINKTDQAYEKLDEEYRNVKFGSLDKFKKYVEKNKDEIVNIETAQYIKNKEDNYKEFVCKDKYGNIYVFHDKGAMDYTVFLDTYTLENEKFTETYQKADAQKKVQMNIDKWVQMLNNRDYTSAYKVLDENFANNTFKGQEENFENYMRLKYPLHYEISFRDDFSQTNNLYVQTITLKDITGEDLEEKNIDIIMRLDDNLDFVMSFTVMSK